MRSRVVIGGTVLVVVALMLSGCAVTIQSINADFRADTRIGEAGLMVEFTNKTEVEHRGTVEPNLVYKWDFDGDGATDSTKKNPTHTYSDPGLFDVSLTVEENGGTSSASVSALNASDTATKEAFIRVASTGSFVQGGDATDINAAIANAGLGGVVVVAAGTYAGDVLADQDGITIAGEPTEAGTSGLSASPSPKAMDKPRAQQAVVPQDNVTVEGNFQGTGNSGTLIDFHFTGNVLLPGINWNWSGLFADGLLRSTPEAVKHSISEEQQDKAVDFWTVERMKQAEPVTEPSPSGVSETATTPLQGDQPAKIVGTGPFIQSSSLQVQHNTTTVPAPYTSYPNRAVGSVFYRSDDKVFRCSAAIVTTGNQGTQRASWTAGHCVHDGGPSGNWKKDWIFVPGYNGDGDTESEVAPFGRWPARELWSLTCTGSCGAWVDAKNAHYDLGAAILADQNGNRVGDVTGTLGISWNQARSQTYDALGYPREGPGFDGDDQIACYDRDYLKSWDYGGDGPNQNVIDCHVTGGASGGPWIINDFQNNCPACYLNSVHSTTKDKDDDEGEELQGGPYHGPGAEVLWNAIRFR